MLLFFFDSKVYRYALPLKHISRNLCYISLSVCLEIKNTTNIGPFEGV